MYTLTLDQTTHQYILANQTTQEQITLAGLGDLGEVYYLIQDQMQASELLRMLTVAEMLQHARANGAPQISSQTITNACNRRAMPNTVKREGRWYAPASAFNEWFDRFLAKRNAGDRRYTSTQTT